MRKLALILLLFAGKVEATCVQYFHNGPTLLSYWLCDAAADAATGAIEGDMRFNKDTNLVQCYDGAAWGVCSSGGATAPGGLDSYVQYNNGGAFGGDALFTWDDTNKALGVGAAGTATVIGNFTKDQNATTVIQSSNSDAAGIAAAAIMQSQSDTAVIGVRAHGSSRSASQCGATLGGTADVIAANATALTNCTLGVVPFYISTNSTRRVMVSGDGVFTLVDSGAKPACAAGYAGGIWFDAAVPDTYEVCTKDSGSVYAWRSIIDTTGAGSANSVETSIALTSVGTYFTSTVAAAWVAAGTEIVCRPFGTTADGLTPEAVVASGVQATVISRSAGVSFDLGVNNPYGLEGTVRFHCLGV